MVVKATAPKRPDRQWNLRLSKDVQQLLTTIKERDGIPYSAQVDRAVRIFAFLSGLDVPEETLPNVFTQFVLNVTDVPEEDNHS